MSTGNEFFVPTNKRLASFEDMGARGFEYLRNLVKETNQYQFRQGSFQEKVTLSSPGANQVAIGAKVVLGDGFVHDGDGHIIDCVFETNDSIFQNSIGVTYEVGVGYVAKPSGIQINPHTGRPEYTSWIETIGDQSDPVSVVNNGSTITFNVNSVDELSAMSLAGRTVRVFMKVPAASATSAAVAIELCTVSYGGGINTITTTGLLGQSIVSTNAADYTIQLVGLSIRPTTAPSPISVSSKHFFAGTVLGNGGTPTVFSTAGQAVIQSDNASDVVFVPYTGGAPLAWGIASTTVQGAIQEIVDDLSDTGGGYKVGIVPLANWADGSTNALESVTQAISNIITNLTSTSGGRGAAKLTAAALANWADGTTNPATTLGAALAKIITDLTSTSAGRGAAKLTAAALSAWADGTTNPATDLGAALAKIVTDLTSTSGGRGFGKLTSPLLTGFKYSIPATDGATSAQYIVDAINETFQNFAQSKLVDVGPRITVGTSIMRAYAQSNGLIVSVGDGGLIRRSSDLGLNWSTSTPAPASPYVGIFYDIKFLGANFIASGNGTLQISSDGITWTEQSTQAGVWGAIAYTFTNGVLICVLTSGVVMTSGDVGSTWANATPINGGTWCSTQSVGGTCAKGDTVVTIGRPVQINPPVRAKAGYYSTDDGVSWTAIDMTAQFSTTEYFAQVVLSPDGQYFVATVEDTAVTTKIMYSADGITWVNAHTFSGSQRYVLTDMGDQVMAAIPDSGSRKGLVSKTGTAWTAQHFRIDYTLTRCTMLEVNNSKMWAFGGVSNPNLPVWAES